MRHQAFCSSYVMLVRGSGEEQEILLHRRENTGYMDGKYDVSASGHVEAGENYEQCAIRETKEEIDVSLKAEDLHFCFLNHNFAENYVNAFFIAELPEGAQPRVCEPDKSGGLLWTKVNDLPENVLPCIPKIIECMKRGIYYDDGNFTVLERTKAIDA